MVDQPPAMVPKCPGLDTAPKRSIHKPEDLGAEHRKKHKGRKCILKSAVFQLINTRKRLTIGASFLINFSHMHQSVLVKSSYRQSCADKLHKSLLFIC